MFYCDIMKVACYTSSLGEIRIIHMAKSKNIPVSKVGNFLFRPHNHPFSAFVLFFNLVFSFIESVNCLRNLLSFKLQTNINDIFLSTKQYPKQEGKSDGTDTTSNINQKLYYHRLGEDQSKDVLVAEFPDNPKWMM